MKITPGFILYSAYCLVSGGAVGYFTATIGLITCAAAIAAIALFNGWLGRRLFNNNQ